MGKISLILALLVCTLGCHSYSRQEIIQMRLDDLPTVKRDGCDYLVEPAGNGKVVYIHLGNCKNPIHYFKDENVMKYKVVIPEGYSLISTNQEKPDTAFIFAKSDSLVINFK